MAVAARVSVTTTPILVANAAAEGTSGAYTAIIRNRGTVAVFLGGATVDATHGYELDPGEWVSASFAGNDSVYGVTASGTARVDVLGTVAP